MGNSCVVCGWRRSRQIYEEFELRVAELCEDCGGSTCMDSYYLKCMLCSRCSRDLPCDACILLLDALLEKTSRENKSQMENTDVKEPVEASCRSRNKQDFRTMFCARCSRDRPCDVCQILALDRSKRAERRQHAGLNGDAGERTLAVRRPGREEIHLPHIPVEDFFMDVIHMSVRMFF